MFLLPTRRCICGICCLLLTTQVPDLRWLLSERTAVGQALRGVMMYHDWLAAFVWDGYPILTRQATTLFVTLLGVMLGNSVLLDSGITAVGQAFLALLLLLPVRGAVSLLFRYAPKRDPRAASAARSPAAKYHAAAANPLGAPSGAAAEGRNPLAAVAGPPELVTGQPIGKVQTELAIDESAGPGLAKGRRPGTAGRDRHGIVTGTTPTPGGLLDGAEPSGSSGDDADASLDVLPQFKPKLKKLRRTSAASRGSRPSSGGSLVPGTPALADGEDSSPEQEEDAADPWAAARNSLMQRIRVPRPRSGAAVVSGPGPRSVPQLGIPVNLSRPGSAGGRPGSTGGRPGSANGRVGTPPSDFSRPGTPPPDRPGSNESGRKSSRPVTPVSPHPSGAMPFNPPIPVPAGALPSDFSRPGTPPPDRPGSNESGRKGSRPVTPVSPHPSGAMPFNPPIPVPAGAVPAGAQTPRSQTPPPRSPLGPAPVDGARPVTPPPPITPQPGAPPLPVPPGLALPEGTIIPAGLTLPAGLGLAAGGLARPGSGGPRPGSGGARPGSGGRPTSAQDRPMSGSSLASTNADTDRTVSRAPPGGGLMSLLRKDSVKKDKVGACLDPSSSPTPYCPVSLPPTAPPPPPTHPLHHPWDNEGQQVDGAERLLGRRGRRKGGSVNRSVPAVFQGPKTRWDGENWLAPGGGGGGHGCRLKEGGGGVWEMDTCDRTYVWSSLAAFLF